MATAGLGSITTDVNGYPVLSSDSHTAATMFGMNDGVFSNVPKDKFLYFVSFVRPSYQGSGWESSIGSVVKTFDLPTISFKTETLNQYNRKRIVQTSHSYGPLNIVFHDTVSEILKTMFIEYYQYYYTDSVLSNISSPNDVVRASEFVGDWGFHPPLIRNDDAQFFSHIDVYQMFGGHYVKYTYLNPKISSFDPDILDYSNSTGSEIKLTFEFESVNFQPITLLTDEIIYAAGLDRARYLDTEDNSADFDYANVAISPNERGNTLGQNITNVLLRNGASVITGQGGLNLGNMISEVAHSYDANRGIAVGKTAINSIKNIVSGNTQTGKQGVQGLLKGVLFGKPGSFF